jgi:hypothetical protein
VRMLASKMPVTAAEVRVGRRGTKVWTLKQATRTASYWSSERDLLAMSWQTASSLALMSVSSLMLAGEVLGAV